MTEEEQRQYYIEKIKDARSKARANLFQESALNKDISQMTIEELEGSRYYFDYLVHNPNSTPPPPESPLRDTWEQRQDIIKETNNMKRQSFMMKNEIDDVPSNEMVMARELQMDPMKRKYQSMNMGLPDDIPDANSLPPMGSPDTNIKNTAPPFKRENDPIIDSDTMQIREPLNRQIPNIASNDVRSSPQNYMTGPETFNPATGKMESANVGSMMDETALDYEAMMANTSGPMKTGADAWYDSLKASFTSNTDAYSDPLLLGGMAINSTDQSPIFPGTSMKGSGTGIMKGAMTGAGLGAKTGNPKGALIGAGIGAVMGLLGNFDSKTQSYTPPPTISRGGSIAFPNDSSMKYYEGLI